MAANSKVSEIDVETVETRHIFDRATIKSIPKYRCLKCRAKDQRNCSDESGRLYLQCNRKWQEVEKLDKKIKFLCGEKTLNEIKKSPEIGICRSCLKALNDAYRVIVNIHKSAWGSSLDESKNANEDNNYNGNGDTVNKGPTDLDIADNIAAGASAKARDSSSDHKRPIRVVQGSDDEDENEGLVKKSTAPLIIQPERTPKGWGRNLFDYHGYQVTKKKRKHPTAVDGKSTAKDQGGVLVTYTCSDGTGPDPSDTYTITSNSGEDYEITDEELLRKITRKEFLEILKSLANSAGVGPGEQVVFRVGRAGGDQLKVEVVKPSMQRS